MDIYGYIRVKILACWGKSLGGHTILQNGAFLEEICTIYVRFLCLNYPTLTESSTSVLQKCPYCQFCSISVPKLSQFRRFPSGKIWLGGFAPCKKIDILQLCSKATITLSTMSQTNNNNSHKKSTNNKNSLTLLRAMKKVVL